MASVATGLERLADIVIRMHTDELLSVDITMQQAKALHVIATDPGIGVSGLAARLRVGPPTASGSLERLVEMGLVDRRQDPLDRRHVVLSLTAEGRAVVGRFRDVGVDILGRHLRYLRPDELAGLQVGLDGLLRVMRPDAPPTPTSPSARPEGAP